MMIDRTAEFGGAAEVLRRLAADGGSITAAVKLPPRPPIHRASLDVAAAIRAAAARTNKLYRLAHRRGLFDDPAAEINDLTGGGLNLLFERFANLVLWRRRSALVVALDNEYSRPLACIRSTTWSVHSLLTRF